MAETSSDLLYILRNIEYVMTIPFTIMRDIKTRLVLMPKVRSNQAMFEAATVVSHLIEAIKKRNIITEVTPEIFNLLVEKSCTYSHCLQYKRM